MGERGENAGATGASWGGREEASWWQGNGDIQQQQQISDQVARSTSSSTHQLFTYKMTGGFQNETTETTPAYDYRVLNASVSRNNESGMQQTQQWWYTNAGIDQQQQSPSQTDQSSPPSQQSEPTSENRQQSLSQAHQALVQQSLQQAIQQQALQQQTIQHQTLQEQLQAVQQHHIQALQHVASGQALQHQFMSQQAVKNMPHGKTEVKPRGRITAYAYFVQSCREEHKKDHPDENVVFAEFSKKCAERWNTMADKEKQRFHELAEQDKKRYEFEMQNYIPPKGEKFVKGKKRKMLKDPNAPKRSLSAFFWFCNDERPKVKASFPEYAMGDIAKELGRRWAMCDPPTKSKYEQLSEQDKARYDQEMTAYKKGPGAINTTMDTDSYQ